MDRNGQKWAEMDTKKTERDRKRQKTKTEMDKNGLKERKTERER